MPCGTRKPGDFCWVNMLTSHSDEAREFFGKLLGWTYAELPGQGHLVQVGGRNIGGLFDLASPNTPPGTPPYIGVMVKVENADAMVEKVTALGGKARPAFDIMDQGRMSVCHDPNGAEFDIWEPKQGPGTDVDSTQHGAPSWYETYTTDVSRATKFYSALFGWTPEIKPMPGFDYTVFKLGDQFVGGLMSIQPHMGAMRPQWATYFTVKDADETAGLAVELGGKVCVPAQDIPEVGRFCGITSPHGVVFYVIKYTT
jgi:predicted enzyme related to lactoylglutathione lyase